MSKLEIFYNPNLPWEEDFLFYEEDDTPVDIADASFRLHVRDHIDDPKILAIASTENGKITIVPEGINIKLTKDDTLNMYQQGKYVCISDVEITFPSGKVVPELVRLEFKVNKSSTRDYETDGDTSS